MITVLEIKSALKKALKHKFALVGGSIIFIFVCIAVLAPFIAPHDPAKINLEKSLSTPDQNYLMGTHKLGRCVLSRLIYGTRVTLGVGFLVVAVTAVMGLILGITSGYFGGLVDEIVMRFVDVLLAFPGIVLALVIVGVLGPSLFNIMLALTLTGWAGFARVIRGTVLSLKEMEFVESARALGASNFYIMRRHIAPNCIAPIIVLASFGMSRVILAISALSFLGLGAQPPTTDWGSMLKEGVLYMRSAPHLVIYPGITIMVSVLAFNFFGDGLRDFFDVRQKDKIEF